MDNDRESIKRNAYHQALKFKNTGLDEEAIFARLEKQGIPVDIAKEVAKNVLLKKLADKDNEIPTPLNSYTVWQKLLKSLFG